ncbi:MAG: hypothetical protein V3S51_04625 [Dehalococcoidia bacterium]
MWKIDSGSEAGATAGSYASALDWNVSEFAAKTILLKNTDGSDSLKYRLLGYAVGGGVAKELVPETLLSPGDIAEFHYDRQWHTLVLQVVDGSGSATYTVDYQGQGA